MISRGGSYRVIQLGPTDLQLGTFLPDCAIEYVGLTLKQISGKVENERLI